MCAQQNLRACVWRDAAIAGALVHRCNHGPPPHRIKVCMTKSGNEKFWRAVKAVAPAKPSAPCGGGDHA
jgi:hypothetical protein